VRAQEGEGGGLGVTAAADQARKGRENHDRPASARSPRADRRQLRGLRRGDRFARGETDHRRDRFRSFLDRDPLADPTPSGEDALHLVRPARLAGCKRDPERGRALRTRLQAGHFPHHRRVAGGGQQKAQIRPVIRS